MTVPSTAPARTPQHSAEDVVALVRLWLERSRQHPVKGSAKLLAGLLAEPGGLAFLTEFVDGVIRPEDHNVAAENFARLGQQHNPYLPMYQRFLLRVGAYVTPAAPWLIVQIARRTVRGMVSHLVVDASPERLGKALGKIRSRGHRLNVNLLGEAVLGRKEAARRLDRTLALLKRPDVDYVSLKVSAAVAPHQPWAFEQNVDHIVETLRPLYRAAVERDGTFINLDMEEYKDLDLTVTVFTRLLGEEEFLGLTAGIVLQAYLPDSRAAPPSRCASSRAPTCRWSGWTPSCTAGPWPRGAPRPSPTPSTSA